jgi:hypothetical protein
MLHVKQLKISNMNTSKVKISLKKAAQLIFAFVVSWIGIMAAIACTVVVAKVLTIYSVYIWNLWL